MSDDGTLIPISDEQAKLGQEVIKAFSGLGSFFKECLGSVRLKVWDALAETVTVAWYVT